MPTKVEWVARPGTTPESWNITTGCNKDGKRIKASPGCDHCYAERMARRLAGRYGYPPAPHHFDVTLHPERLEQPLRWRKPRTVFVCSMGDLFHEAVPDEWIDKVFSVIDQTPQHTYLILTKRAQRMDEYTHNECYVDWQWPHVWLGTTIEKPEYLWRAHYLRHSPAAVHFLSLEPLLASFAEYPGVVDDIDWVIAGGESGPGARPAHPDWFRGLRDQCQAAGVAYFFKQHGAWLHRSQITDWTIMTTDMHCWTSNLDASYLVGKKAAGRLLDGREWNEWPRKG